MNILNLIFKKIIIHNYVVTAKKKSFSYFGHKNVIIDSKIFDLLSNTCVNNSKDSKGVITMLSKNTKDQDMLSTAIKLPLLQAIRRITKELKNGYFDEPKKRNWLTIYLSDISGTNDEPSRLDLRWYSNGGAIGLYVENVKPNDFFFLDYGIRVGFLSN